MREPLASTRPRKKAMRRSGRVSSPVPATSGPSSPPGPAGPPRPPRPPAAPSDGAEAAALPPEAGALLPEAAAPPPVAASAVSAVPSGGSAGECARTRVPLPRRLSTHPSSRRTS